MSQITNPAVFFIASALVVGYFVYIMVRSRGPNQPDPTGREPEL